MAEPNDVMPTPDIRRLAVCAGSAAMFGLLAYDDAPPAIEQLCRDDECPHRDDPSHRGRGLPEPANDLRMHVELCHCCASTVIPTGSRLSLFYCDACAEFVRQLAREAGAVLLPFGRHSIMNGLALSGADAASPDRRDAFVTETMGMFARIDHMHAWRQLVVGERIESMRPGAHSMAAAEYLSHCERSAPPRPEMFRQLCRSFGIDAAV